MTNRIILAVLLVAILLLSVLTGCSQSSASMEGQSAPQQEATTAPQTTQTDGQASGSSSIPQPPALPE